MIQAVLFDMDGVLLDSEEFMLEAGIQMFKEKGTDVKADDFKEFTGMGENQYLGGVAQKYGIPFNIEKDKSRAYDIYDELVKGKLEALNGVKDFIKKCLGKNLLIAVATSADKRKMMINLRETGLNSISFHALVNGMEVKNKKPHPDIYIEAARRLEVEPDNCLVVEDAVSGVKAAKAAGCRCLAITTTFNADELQEADWHTSDFEQAPDECLNW